MKKKIRYLTLEECEKICLSTTCESCPLCHFSPDNESIRDCPFYEDSYLEKEVECSWLND